jgi:DNA-binding transcriptional regulator LsrR (DeoR family)
MDASDARKLYDDGTLAHVADLYYQEGLTQAQIASQIHTSRSTVSRLLHEARERGIVEIVIHYTWSRNRAMEQELVRAFSLREARVIVDHDWDYERILHGLGASAARYLEGVVEPGVILGISWGTAILSTVRRLKPKEKLPITVVQMIGATGAKDPLTDGPELARLLADVYGGRYRSLHAPLTVESASVREGLLNEPHIRETLELASQADLALVGIGTLVPEYSSWLRAGYLDRDGLAELRAAGAVGDICGWHYDVHGNFLVIDMNRRIVGVQPQTLSEIERVIAVAGGQAKVKAILGGLRTGLVDTLVTGEQAAKGVLGAHGVG